MSERQTVADYIVGRLAREGITDCFGVAGDFAFKLCDAVARSDAVRWIGCSNELDAAYAADGYARVRGCSMLLTTYAVGELSALNGVMGAKAERSCVFHIVGMPAMRKQRVRQVVHHTLGDGEFQNFANISAQAACVSAVITPDNCTYEMERLIATARAESRPAYVLVAADYAVTPVTGSAPPPYPASASGPDLAKAVAAIAERVEAARSVAMLPAYTVSRFKLQGKLRALVEALGCPYCAMAMDKGVLSEAHPQFAGIYSGAASSPAVLEAVEGADVVIDAGGVSFNEVNTAAYTSHIDPGKLVTIGVDQVRIGDRIYNPVRMGDVFDGLAGAVSKNFGYSAPPRGVPTRPGGKPDDPITAVNMYPRFRDFLRPADRIVLESGSMSSGMVPLPLPDGAEVQLQPLWGSIGWATGATLGIALADPSRRTVLFTGEGSHQMTAVDVGTMARHGLKPVIFVLNNEGYMVERALEADPDWVYNDLAPWNYHALPAALGCRGWFTAKVTTLGELDAALARAATGESASYIEVVGGRLDFPAGLAMAHQRLDALYADG
ncbi:MAG: thiamine pyrophosphate-binding protein [Paludisphaera borealis]|uniref:alpha-keto acid decarboxylase family protein n=1 Tax=Paludisphaera borealis TaxID=1387353 RepID=UPI0028470659|nr:thiamine pyrophosphate-binding protein [Paludisphaera borealis]MDR3618743.1 thiamine pyrophosphate-binding protein [Paludisphaera borealis]